MYSIATMGSMTNLLDLYDTPINKMIRDLYALGIATANFTLSHPVTKKFIESDAKFDVIILEIYQTESLLGFAHKFNAPIIGFSTIGANKWTTDLVGSPSPMSYVPHTFLR